MIYFFVESRVSFLEIGGTEDEVKIPFEMSRSIHFKISTRLTFGWDLNRL